MAAAEGKAKGRPKGYSTKLKAYKNIENPEDKNYYTDNTYTTVAYTEEEAAALLADTEKATTKKVVKKVVKTEEPDTREVAEPTVKKAIKKTVKKATKKVAVPAIVEEPKVRNIPAAPFTEPGIKISKEPKGVLYRDLMKPELTLDERVRYESISAGYYHVDVSEAVQHLPYVSLMNPDAIMAYRNALMFRVGASMNRILSNYFVGKMCSYVCPIKLDEESETYQQFKWLAASLDMCVASLYNCCLISAWYSYDFIESLCNHGMKFGYVMEWEHWLKFYSDGIEETEEGAKYIKKVIANRATIELKWPEQNRLKELVAGHPNLATESDALISVTERVVPPDEIIVDTTVVDLGDPVVEPEPQAAEEPVEESLILHHLASGTGGIVEEPEIQEAEELVAETLTDGVIKTPSMEDMGPVLRGVELPDGVSFTDVNDIEIIPAEAVTPPFDVDDEEDEEEDGVEYEYVYEYVDGEEEDGVEYEEVYEDEEESPAQPSSIFYQTDIQPPGTQDFDPNAMMMRVQEMAVKSGATTEKEFKNLTK